MKVIFYLFRWRNIASGNRVDVLTVCLILLMHVGEIKKFETMKSFELYEILDQYLSIYVG